MAWNRWWAPGGGRGLARQLVHLQVQEIQQLAHVQFVQLSDLGQGLQFIDLRCDTAKYCHPDLLPGRALEAPVRTSRRCLQPRSMPLLLTSPMPGGGHDT